ADGQDGPFQLGRDVLCDVVVGPREVVEAVRPGLQVAAPPLVEPDLGAADGGADGLDGSAGEAQGNGALARREFVVHGYLRGAAAGGCPAGESYRGWAKVMPHIQESFSRLPRGGGGGCLLGFLAQGMK